MEQITLVLKHSALLGCLIWITCITRCDALCPSTHYEVAKLCSRSTATGSRVFLDASSAMASDTNCTCRLVTSADELEVQAMDAPGEANCESRVEFRSESMVTFECFRTGTVIKTDHVKEFDVVFKRTSSSALANYCVHVKARPVNNGVEAEVSLFCESKRREILETQEISTETGVIPPDTSLTTEKPTTNTSDLTTSTGESVTGKTTAESSNTSTVISGAGLSSTTRSPKTEESQSAGLDTTTIIIIAVVAAVVVIATIIIFVVVYISRRNKHGKDVRGHNYVYYNDGEDVDEKPKNITENDETQSVNEGKTTDTTNDNVVLVSDNYHTIDPTVEANNIE
ncbi:uncharacterized protein LOC121372525 [Gigantopelta aegis]|uniref:uncharacterized protein LOC121372525 n=1 Tax=Gigantopelta aegis TaxID=1735272 RepID=UPI001B8887C0|nr:uncharacterized protein LOC121372525 [Gigantopelta aegis]